MKYSRKYVPSSLTQKDRRQQIQMLRQSQNMYRRGQYKTRKTVKSFQSRPSSHVQRAKQIYQVDVISPNVELARKTGCSISAMKQIVRKGEGAYYSSGSRPNQTPQSWGIARLASALTHGKASEVDAHILRKGCKGNKKKWN
jgi:hypothetical protein